MTNDNATNTVKASNQVSFKDKVSIFRNNGKIKVLFLGNSITRHAPDLSIGWPYDFGMAATCIENDYVHVMLKELNKKYGSVDYCICSLSVWEKEYWNLDILNNYKEAVDFDADIVIVRLCENTWGVRDMFEKYPLAFYWDKMINFFKNDHCKLIVTDDFWSWKTIDDPIHEVCEKNNYLLVKLGDIGADASNKAIGQFKHEGVAIHPNDKGMKAIADRILKEGGLLD